MGLPERVCIAHPETHGLLERVFVTGDLIHMSGTSIDHKNSISSIVQRYGQQDEFQPIAANTLVE